MAECALTSPCINISGQTDYAIHVQLSFGDPPPVLYELVLLSSELVLFRQTGRAGLEQSNFP